MSNPSPGSAAGDAGDVGGLVPQQPAPLAGPAADLDATVRAASQFLELERQRVELGRAQVVQQQIDGQRAHEYALALLAAQERDLKDRRRAEAGNGRLGFIFLLVLVVALVSLAAYALSLGKDAFLLDVVKVIAGALAGGGVGYGIGRGKREGDGTPQNPATSA